MLGRHKQEVEQFDLHIDSFRNEKVGMETYAGHHVELRLVGNFSERQEWRIKTTTIVIFILYCTSSLLTGQGIHNVPHLLCE